MKICKDHWQMMRDAVEERGLSNLVAKSGEAAIDNEVRQLEEHQQTGEVSEETLKETFDPLISMNWHWCNNALRNGGLYIMGQNEDGVNDGHYCPICEYVKHVEGFEAKSEIESVADQMRAYCVEQKLVPAVQ